MFKDPTRSIINRQGFPLIAYRQVAPTQALIPALSVIPIILIRRNTEYGPQCISSYIEFSDQASPDIRPYKPGIPSSVCGFCSAVYHTPESHDSVDSAYLHTPFVGNAGLVSRRPRQAPIRSVSRFVGFAGSLNL